MVAVRNFILAGDAGPIGYDLDGVCTCQDAGESCLPPVAASVHCDDRQGRDLGGNFVFGEFFQTFLASTPLGSIDDRIDAGLFSFLMSVRHYGEGNVSNVSFDIFPGSGLFEFVDAGDGGTTAKTRSPSWDGNDLWAIDCNQASAPCPNRVDLAEAGPLSSSFADRRAFVVDGGTLVAHLPSLVLGFGFSDMRLTNAIITANVTHDERGYELDGQIVGRAGLHDMFRTLAAFHQGSSHEAGTYYCGDNTLFAPLRQQLCNALDISSDPSNDRKGKLCDAISVAIPFRAFPAKIGYQLNNGEIPRGCDGGAALEDDCTKQ
jgi:hypothetical protein